MVRRRRERRPGIVEGRREVAQLGSAPASGAGGRGFKSRLPDQVRTPSPDRVGKIATMDMRARTGDRRRRRVSATHTTPMRDAAVVRAGWPRAGTRSPRRAILVQDATLPSVTTIVTGEPVRGSWWAHEQAHSIFDVLEALEPDATVRQARRPEADARAPLDSGRRSQPSAATGAPWQFDGLGADARAVVDQVDRGRRAGARRHARRRGRPRPRADVVRDVERRLLAPRRRGAHASRAATRRCCSRGRAGRPTAASPDPCPIPARARAAFEAAVRRCAPDRVATLLPWPVEVPS